MGRNRSSTFALRAPWITLSVVAAATAILGFQARSLPIDLSLDALLAGDDPERAYHQEVEKVFGSEDVTLVGMFGDDVFQPASLTKIAELSRQIGDLDDVQQVVSLTTVQSASSDDEGLHVGKLVREIPSSPEEVETLRLRTLANPLYLRHVVAADGRAAGITVVYRRGVPGTEVLPEREAQIRDLVAAAGGPETFAVSHAPAMRAAQGGVDRRAVRFAALALLTIAVILAAGLRSALGIWLPLATAVVGLVWTLGAMTLAGSGLHLGNVFLPPLLVALGLAFSVPLVRRYQEAIEPQGPAVEVVAATMREVGIPVAVCAVIVALAFMPFALSPLAAVRDFGVDAILGIAALLIATFTLVPASLVLWPLPHRQAAHRARGPGLLGKIGVWSLANRRLVFLAAALAAVVSLPGIGRLRPGIDTLSPLDGARRESAAIAERLAGAQPISLVLDGEGDGSVTKLKTLQAIKELQTFAAEQPGVDTAVSLLDYLGVLRHALDAGELGSLPTSQEEVDQLFLFASSEDLKPLVNGDHSRAQVLLRTKLSDSGAVNELVERLQSFAATHLPRGVTLHPTGAVVLLNRAADEIARGQRKCLWQASALLFVAFSVVFLSLRIGFVTLVATAMPVILLFGIVGWWGIGLALSTVPLASLVLALAITQTILLLGTFHREGEHGSDPPPAVARAMQRSGPAVVIAAVASMAGLFCLGLAGSPFAPLASLAAAAIGAGLLLACILHPALASALRVITLWDLLGLDLGHEPQRQIPLFAGLRLYQAKIVVLMARRGSVGRGSFVTRRGETPEELYVLLEGRADEYHGEGGPVIRHLGRGDVIGDIGLLEQRLCAADVVVAEGVHYIAFDRRFLERIQRRYPRMAAVLLLNLARVLSDRLESITEALGESRPRN